MFEKKAGKQFVRPRDDTSGMVHSRIAKPVMPINDYRAMCTSNFTGVLGKAKAAALAIKAVGWTPPQNQDGSNSPNKTSDADIQ